MDSDFNKNFDKILQEIRYENKYRILKDNKEILEFYNQYYFEWSKGILEDYIKKFNALPRDEGYLKTYDVKQHLAIALTCYKSDYAYRLNSALRGKCKLEDGERKYVELLDKGFNTCTLEENIILFRYEDEKMINRFNIKNKTTWRSTNRAYVSTSLSKEFMKGKSNIMIIQVARGSRCMVLEPIFNAQINAISPFYIEKFPLSLSMSIRKLKGYYYGEAEILLPRNAIFELDKVIYDKNGKSIIMTKYMDVNKN